MKPPVLLISALVVLSLSPSRAAAEPMRLADPSPRWVVVQFESSPSHRPDQLDTVYTSSVRGWLEPGEGPGTIRISIPGASVERVVLVDERAVPGSFGSFVWIFDAASGEVISARLSGRLIKSLDWGLFRTDVETPIRIQMGTAEGAGFRAPHHLFGQTLHGYCAEVSSAQCTMVAPVHYDAAQGYVNAVGVLFVDFRGITLRTFSPLGEALFSEVEAVGAAGGPGISQPFSDEEAVSGAESRPSPEPNPRIDPRLAHHP